MCVNALSGLCLISTTLSEANIGVGFRSVSMPSRASTSFLHQFQRSIKECYSVSMPSRASTSFLQYPFKNLGFMRFPEPVFAGICQNILAVAHFHAC